MLRLKSVLVSLKRATTINDNFRSHRPARLVRRQIQHRLGYFFRRAKTAKWDSRDNLLIDLLAVGIGYTRLVIQWRVDRTRADRIDSNTTR